MIVLLLSPNRKNITFFTFGSSWWDRHLHCTQVFVFLNTHQLALCLISLSIPNSLVGLPLINIEFVLEGEVFFLGRRSFWGSDGVNISSGFLYF